MRGFVAGFGRCGTSLTMAMLAAGGLPVVGSGEAFEDRRFGTEHVDHGWLARQSGILKWVDPIQTPVCRSWAAQTIWLDRDPVEQAKSQIKLAVACGVNCRGDEKTVAHIAAMLIRNREEALRRASWHGPVTVLTFELLLSDPARAAGIMSKAFGAFGELDQDRAIQIVRQRDTRCAVGLELDLAQLKAELLEAE